MLSELIEELKQIKDSKGDMFVGFEDDSSYTSNFVLKAGDNQDITIDISRNK